MESRKINQSYCRLYNSGLLSVIINGQRQLDEMVNEARAARRRQFELSRMVVEVCPCGCGLVGDVCDNHLAQVAAKNEELPF